MGRLRQRGPAPDYAISESEDSELRAGDPSDEEGSLKQLGKRVNPGRSQRAQAGARMRGNEELSDAPASKQESEGEDDPIEDADEPTDDECRDADFQVEDEEMAGEEEDEERQQSGDSGWDEEDSEDAVQSPRRPVRGTRRSARRRQEEEDEEDSEEEGRHVKPRRAAAQPNYREESSGEDQEESEEEEEQEEEEKRPRRQQQARRPATRHGGVRQRKQPAGARRSGRERARVQTYNEDELLGDLPDSSEEEQESSSEEEEEGSGQDARPTRRAAKAAGRAIRQQAGGVKRRKQPKRAAAPAKRRQMIEDSSNGEDSQSDSGSGQRQSDGSMSGSGSDSDVADHERWHVEKILDSRAAEGGGEEFRCKFEGKSYRKTHWLPYDTLAEDRLQLLRNFQKKKAAGELDPYGDLVEGVHPDWLQVDRVIAHRFKNGQRHLLVKWRGLGYAECTWEPEKELAGEEAHIERYERFNTPPTEEEEEDQPKELDVKVPEFCNGRQLRDYQLVSLEWNIRNWSNQVNCILGDEMGLGKTAQSISVLAYQKQFGGVRGPFLVIAPLTTLGHWQREIETWTDMNCVVYAGGAADRDVIQKYDLFFGEPGSRHRRGSCIVKPNVVLSSYETVLKDSSLFTSIIWETVIIDEAHRMKSTASSTRAVIASMSINWLLLLTGTPVQNNMRELFGILNLLDRDKFDDEQEFLEKFGDERSGMTPEQVKALQEELRPILLRRMKEDVETLPEKEEVIIWVELTPEQRVYYKAIYENQIGTLLAGASSKNMPNLRNLAMELRKVCCHPFLCNGLEEDIQRRKLEAGAEALGELEQLVQASGKMVLLHKLLPKLRAEGHKVLIFSQFKMMLDVLEDYLKLAGHPLERIDGSTSSRDRQAAIDRFSREGSDGFVFLLSTRAGGQGITLTAADTCVIFDSDWNPQNDLQAMARCHRIGQDKEVTIYRLVSKNSYEENIFHMSSRKYGLDEAILGNLGGGSEASGGSGGGNPEDDVRKIADLLKHGAHCLHEVEAAAEQGGAFAAEGIDQILQGRTEKRQIGGRAGNTFSVATFAVGAPAGGAGSSGDDKSYWASLLPEAVQGHEAAEAARRAPVILAPRRRKQVDYKGQMAGKFVSRGATQDEDYVAEEQAEAADDDFQAPKSKKQKKGKGEGEAAAAFKRWRNDELAAFEPMLLQLGAGRAADVKREADLQGRTAEECAELEAGMLRALRHAAPLVERHEEQHKAELQQQKQQQQQAKQQPTIASGDYREAGGEADGGAAAAAAGAGDGEAAGGQGGKGKGHKKARDSAVQDALVAWLEAEMQDAPPAVAQALRSKQFLDWAAVHAAKGVAQLKQREVLAEWVRSAAAGEVSPGGATFKRALPQLRSKHLPAHWWREADTRSLLAGIHELGWVPRKGRAQSDILDSLVADERFGFPKRVVVTKPAPFPGSPAVAAAPQQAQPGADAMLEGHAGQQQQQQEAEAGVADETELQQQQHREPLGADVAAADQPGQQQAEAQPPAEAAAAGANPASPAKAAPEVTTLGSPSRPAGPRTITQQEWGKLSKRIAEFVNLLLAALASPETAPPPRRLSDNKPAGGIAGSSRGPASEATPLNAAAAAGKPAAAAAVYTNPLTSQGGGSGQKPGSAGKGKPGSSQKPQLPLHPSTAHKSKGKVTQQSIVGFFKKKDSTGAASATGVAGAPTNNSPGHKENQSAGAAAGGSKQQQPAEQEVVVIDD